MKKHKDAQSADREAQLAQGVHIESHGNPDFYRIFSKETRGEGVLAVLLWRVEGPSSAGVW